MSQIIELNRRAFLKNAGAAALVSTVGTGTVTAAEKIHVAQGPSGSEFDFDEIYDRVGTDCTKWDRQIERFGEDIQVGMGIADMDFRAAPCITKALHGAMPA